MTCSPCVSSGLPALLPLRRRDARRSACCDCCDCCDCCCCEDEKKWARMKVRTKSDGISGWTGSHVVPPAGAGAGRRGRPPAAARPASAVDTRPRRGPRRAGWWRRGPGCPPNSPTCPRSPWTRPPPKCPRWWRRRGCCCGSATAWRTSSRTPRRAPGERRRRGPRGARGVAWRRTRPRRSASRSRRWFFGRGSPPATRTSR